MKHVHKLGLRGWWYLRGLIVYHRVTALHSSRIYKVLYTIEPSLQVIINEKLIPRTSDKINSRRICMQYLRLNCKQSLNTQATDTNFRLLVSQFIGPNDTSYRYLLINNYTNGECWIMMAILFLYTLLICSDGSLFWKKNGHACIQDRCIQHVLVIFISFMMQLYKFYNKVQTS